MSYKSFDFSFPTRICFGIGESKKAAEYIAALKPCKVFVTTYKDIRLPILDLLLTGLDDKNIPYVLFNECVPNPKAEHVDAATKVFLDNHCDMIIGVGGGSVIDMSKAIALLAANSIEGGIWKYVSYEQVPQNPALPVALLVTIASTGSESNGSFVLTDKSGNQKLIYTNDSMRPVLSICDPQLSVTLSRKQTALGAADIFSHVLEQYIHCDSSVDTSDNMSLGIMQSIVKWAPVALDEPDNLDARSNLMWAAILAMSRILGVGHEENWICHMLEHAISAKYDIPHAAGMTAIIPSYIDFILPQDKDGKLKELGVKLFGTEKIKDGLVDFFNKMDLPTNLYEATGIMPDKDTIRTLAENALPWGKTAAGGYKDFTIDDAEEVIWKSFDSVDCKNYDIVIIGAGAVGNSIAYRLSRYTCSVAVVDKELDVGMGASTRNSAVVHAGFNNRPGSLMAKLCVEGNKEFEALCKELDVPYKRTGKLVVGFNEDDKAALEELMEQGIKNGCTGLSLIGKEEIEALVPGTSAKYAMLSADTAIINPFLYCIHLAEAAATNGVTYHLGCEVTSIKRCEDGFIMRAGEENIKAKLIINAAGLFADKVSAMAGEDSYKIYPCRGEYYILDKETSNPLKLPIYPVPKKGIGGLGVHITPTIDGNILIGPSAQYIEEHEDYSTTKDILEQLSEEAKHLLPGIDMKKIIGTYAGVRAKLVAKGKENYGDFIIEHSKVVPGLINLIGIESPGLTASMPIAKMAEGIVRERISLINNDKFKPGYKRIPSFAEANDEQRNQLIKQDPDYGEIVCRCESITKAEIKRAINNPLGAKGIIAVKNRTRATMGRCNGGYCLTRIVDTLIEEGNLPENIALKKKDDRPFLGKVK